jgi:hypothetical protein
MNRSLDLGMMTIHRLPVSHRTKALNRQHHTGKFPIPSPQILFSITARSQSSRSNGDHVPGGVVTKVGECSCRYNEDIREHAVVRSMHREDIIIEKK